MHFNCRAWELLFYCKYDVRSVFKNRVKKNKIFKTFFYSPTLKSGKMSWKFRQNHAP